jgi:hypothetical protein
LDAEVATAVGVDAARHVRRLVLNNLPAQALVERSRTASLLVVGARGLEGFRSLLVGPVSDQCAHHAHCPVAVIHATDQDGRLGGLRRDPNAAGPERIVVGDDGTAAPRWNWYMPGISPARPWCEAPFEVAAERIRQRASAGTDPSDATPAIAEAMADDARPWPSAITIDTGTTPDEALETALAALT